MKRIVSMILSCVLMFSVFSSSLLVKAEETTGDIYSQDTYDGFELTWINNGERDILLSATNGGGTISFQYDEDYNRIAKSGPSGTAYFVYDEYGRMIGEQRAGHNFAYTYDAYGDLSTITIDNVVYNCGLENGSVAELYDISGSLVVSYLYENGYVSKVYGVDMNGDLVDKSNDETFVGNLNRVTYASFYYDEEIGWYYRGRFYDVKKNRYIDGRVGVFEEYLENLSNISTYGLTAETVQSRGDFMYSVYMEDATCGVPVNSYSSGWYNNLNIPADVIARTIYGENPFAAAPDDERVAVAWVIWNRRSLAGWPNTCELVCEQAGQFQALTGVPTTAGDPTLKARQPETTSTMWKCALKAACYLYAAELLQGQSGVDNQLLQAMPKPYGITNQVSFRNYNGFKDYINGGGSVTNIALAGHGTYATGQAAFEAYEALRPTKDTLNIFFN